MLLFSAGSTASTEYLPSITSPRWKEQWRAVLDSKSATEERERAKLFAACASKERMSLQLEFLDRTSGQQVPVANVASAASPLTVRVTLKGGDEPQMWQPLDNASVLELLGE